MRGPEMDCLDEETIEALAAGTAEGRCKADALAHLRQCSRCRKTVRESLVLYRALGWLFASETRDGCPSGQELADYDEGGLAAPARDRIQHHLKSCVRCAADLHELKTAREEILASQPAPESRQTTRGIHPAAAVQPVQALLQRAVREVFQLLGTIEIACFAPRTPQLAVLRAATGSGFQSQTLTTGPDAPFELEMAQFGEEVRVTLRVRPGKPAYTDALVRLVFVEGETPKFSKIIAVAKGKGACVFNAEEVAVCRPQQQALAASVEILDVGRMLQSALEGGTIESLASLLADPDPAVRRALVGLLAWTGQPGAVDLIAPLHNDPNPSVRKAAAAAMKRLTES